MIDFKIQNAIIKSVSITTERCLTAWVFVEGEGWGCGFGGYVLDEYNPISKEREGTAFGAQFLLEIMRTLESETWEGLAGKSVRVETRGIGDGIKRIGHFLKDQWFDPQVLAEKYRDTPK